MGVVLRVTGDEPALERARSQLQAVLAEVDQACNRFREDSELSRVNRSEGRPTQVGPVLIDALVHAIRAAALTAGAVDPAVGRSLERAGYDRDWSALEHTGSLVEHTGSKDRRLRDRASRSAGWRAIRLDHEHRLVRIPAGVSLDLGATAKAWAADRAAGRAARGAGCAVLVGIGGDIATSGAPRGGWRIRVTDDHRSGPAAPGQTVAIKSGAVATSSIAVRRWRHGQDVMHHIIDPGTGAPASAAWRTVSVAAASCFEANVATTGALVKGDAALAWLDSLGLPARLVGHDGAVTRLGGWPASGARAAVSGT